MLIVSFKTTMQLKDVLKHCVHRRPTDNESVNYVHFPINHHFQKPYYRIVQVGIINLNLCTQQFELPRHFSVIQRLVTFSAESTYIPTYPWHLKRVTLGRAGKKKITSTLSILYYHCENEGSRSVRSFSCFGTYPGRAEWFLSI